MRPWQKQLGRGIYRTVCDIKALCNRPNYASGVPRLYYGGARSGSAGGPLVKVGLLQREFPEFFYGFNLVYLLSGSLHLSGFALKTLRSRNIPMVLNQNGVFFPAWYPVGWEAQNARLAGAIENASHVFYQSEFCQRAADKFTGVRAKSSEVLYNAVDTTVFQPRNQIEIQGRPVRLLLTGKIGNATSSRLLSTIEGLVVARKGGIEAELAVYGVIDDGVMTSAHRLIDQYHLNRVVTFHGSYSHHKAPEIYRRADIYVINKHNDACPNVVLEALASGLPVLYSASGGIPELVGDDAGVGLQVPEDFSRDLVPEPGDFAAGLSRIMANYRDMARSARVRAIERFDLQYWLKRHHDVFTKLIQERT